MAENSGHEQPMPLGVAQSDEGPKKKKKGRARAGPKRTNPAAEVPSGLEGRAGAGRHFKAPVRGPSSHHSGIWDFSLCGVFSDVQERPSKAEGGVINENPEVSLSIYRYPSLPAKPGGDSVP